MDQHFYFVYGLLQFNLTDLHVSMPSMIHLITYRGLVRMVTVLHATVVHETTTLASCPVPDATNCFDQMQTRMQNNDVTWTTELMWGHIATSLPSLLSRLYSAQKQLGV